jgi:predicted GIY-YIG superfamily endonuclease
MSASKHCVYILRSLVDPSRYYTGITTDPAARLDSDNAAATLTGEVEAVETRRPHTFSDPTRGLALERYLTSGSGVAFAKRHLR